MDTKKGNFFFLGDPQPFSSSFRQAERGTVPKGTLFKEKG
jgi:hypothetical protein